MQPHQRPGYTAQSPPLHHPVPQHVSTVPMMRSPPPLQQGGAGYSSSPYSQGGPQQQQQQQQQPPPGGQSHVHPAYGGFLNDPTAQMGFQLGKTVMSTGQEYVEQNLGRYVNVTALKHYFNVSNSYVINKLRLVLFPWRHRPWSRIPRHVGPGQPEGQFLPPRDDINSPDMYIPSMAFVTYILLYTMLSGLRGNFHPELLGRLTWWSLFTVLVEIMGLKFGCYLLNINNESQLLDLIAYSGYKFVGIIVTMLTSALMGGHGMVTWLGFGYCFLANAFFLLRSLKYVLLPENSSQDQRGTMHAIARSQRNRRTQFLFLYSYVVQFLFMWVLSSI